ncbi:methyltransferase domain-containing protein [Candidatus Poriferisocius sp.]|uniref:methyltransferase domain-containing protein n=1 Tax=Candidatus Poriferisocius sp. TaxID=3101276 RepID=UPI003B02BEE2
MDVDRVTELAGDIATHMAGATTMAMVHIGDELGLYRAMAGAGPMTAAMLAQAVNCHPRLVTEWLRQQAAVGLVELHGEERGDFPGEGEGGDHHPPGRGLVNLPGGGEEEVLFELSDEAAVVLAWEVSPAFLAGGIGMFRSMFADMDDILEAFRGDGALAWGDHHPCLFTSTARFFRPQYEAYLANEWIPAADGIHSKLQAGAAAADVGCGCGDSVQILASAYPLSRFTGIDFHGPSIDRAIELAAAAGLDNASFEVADSKGYRGPYDVIFFLDCLHDMGDPVGAAAHARSQLTEGGSVLVVEPFALDGHTRNLAENPMAATSYGASAVFCTPCSLAQPVGLGLGAQAGESAMRAVFTEAGYSRFERVTETRSNIVYQARP